MSNIFQRLRSAFTNRPLGQSPIPVGQYPVYPAASMINYIKAYTDNSTVYTIVDLMARKFAFIPRYLYKIDNSTGSDQDKRERKAARRQYHTAVKQNSASLTTKKIKELIKKAYQDDVVEGVPLSLLLAQPNPYQGQDSFYQMVYTYKKTTGNSFVWLNRGDNDGVTGDSRLNLPIIEMWVLPSQYVTIRVDRDYLFGQIVGYIFYDSGMPIYLAKEDVLHWKNPNPMYDSYNFTQMYGVSPLQSGIKLIAQDDSGRDAAVAMFQNGGARGVLYNETMDNLTPEQVTASDSAIDTKINNRAMKSAVAMLPGKWGYLYTGQNAVDMDLMDAQDKTFQRICNLFGCNPQIFETKTTFNNVAQARKDLITNAILPDCASYRDEENRVLLQAFGYSQSQYCIDVDVTDLPELQDDMALLTQRTMTNWTLTPNEMRKELGFDPVADPDMDNRYIPTTLTLLEDAAVPTSSLDPNTGFGEDQTDSGGQVSDSSNGQPKPGNKKGLPSGEVNEAWRKASLRA